MRVPWRGTDPEDLSGDVGDPVFLQCVAFGVLHQICDGTGATELHHQLEERTGGAEKTLTSWKKGCYTQHFTSSKPLPQSFDRIIINKQVGLYQLVFGIFPPFPAVGNSLPTCLRCAKIWDVRLEAIGWWEMWSQYEETSIKAETPDLKARATWRTSDDDWNHWMFKVVSHNATSSCDVYMWSDALLFKDAPRF